MTKKYNNKDIESKSLDLLESYGRDKNIKAVPPVDPIDIIEHLGYDVVYRNDGIYEDKNILGGLNIDKKNVEVNEKANTHEGRENFTLAHEIGHIFLHSERISLNNNEKLCRTEAGIDINTPDQLEWEADKFAAFLLMPTENVKIAFNSIRNKPLYLKRNILFRYLLKRSLRTSSINFSRKVIEAGNFTNVSKLAMVNRLIGMGLIRGLRYQKNKENKS